MKKAVGNNPMKTNGINDEQQKADCIGLPECVQGAEAWVVDVHGDSAIAVRLREVGMVPGTRVRIIRRGSPMIVELGNSKYCLRGQEASLVTVQPNMPMQTSTEEMLSAPGVAGS